MPKEKAKKAKSDTFYSFPKGFLWGAATSAYQVEGGNKNSDWEKWTKKIKIPPAGKAIKHYKKYEEDFKLAKELYHNAHRLSCEWARIEPEKGKFNDKEIEHYEKVLKSLKEKGIKTFVTLHHFTNPQWFSDLGSWEHKGSPQLFARYAKFIAKRLDKYIDYYLTLNEPEIYTFNGWVVEKWPPQKSSLIDAYRVYKNLAKAHKAAYREIKKISKSQVGLAKNNALFEPKPPARFLDYAIVWANRHLINNLFIFWIKRQLDFIGLNFYFHNLLQFDIHIKHVIGARVENVNLVQNDLGWEIYPRAILKVLRQMKRWKKPIIITENGIADGKDTKRERFILDHLFYIHKAIGEGIDVFGYLYWSLLDNYEWKDGFAPRFGLIEVDYKSFERKIRKSAKTFGLVARDNGFSRTMYRKAKYR